VGRRRTSAGPGVLEVEFLLLAAGGVGREVERRVVEVPQLEHGLLLPDRREDAAARGAPLDLDQALAARVQRKDRLPQLTRVPNLHHTYPQQ
jgi:hypothetical protein